ncbi:hypothetical protein SAMN04515667_0975 [Formosa sp. Hel1_31_208]|uniref:hypothetical protein n=1 Tax=Formosa sp. Hel1_31_208 TaxID=1798225 RepID=UPI00087BCA04|nr:hypothetical protein [Formosa sp. Hel1_31_208]SDR91279.1 hypothetical protein SAMN04515667_0975 [Formosa sp. Hel1_31_208]
MLLIVQDTAQMGLFLRLLMLVVAYLIVKFTRRKLLKKLNVLMMTTSKKAIQEPADETIVEDKPTLKPLTIRELTSSSELPDAKTIRATMVSRAQAEFKTLFLTDLLVVAVYGLVPYLCSFLVVYMDAPMYFFYVFILLIWTVMRFIGHRNQFKAYKSGIFGFLSPLSKKLFFPFQALWCQVLFIFLMLIGLKEAVLYFSIGEIMVGIAFIVPILFHLYTMWHRRKKGREKTNIKLLILRVFLLSDTSVFTFSTLAKYWKHFGSYFTVADPSFYRVFWKRQYKRNFPIFIIVVFMIFTFFTDDQSMETIGAMFAFFTVLLLIGAFIYIAKATKSMSNKFMHTEDQLKARLADLDQWPTKYDNTFKEFPVMCYDNTWKVGVNTLVHEASVIMMDLRGFSEKNKGCEFEIDFILDHVPVHRIVFVCSTEAVDLVRKTITERWASLAGDSPNHKIEDPKAALFITEKENSKELQGIMDLLLKAAQGV